MVSDIKGIDTRQAASLRQGEAESVRSGDRKGRTERAGGAAQDDTVELSGLAEVVKTTAQQLAAEPAANESRVTELRNALSRGDYQVDPERLARRLIDADNL